MAAYKPIALVTFAFFALSRAGATDAREMLSQADRLADAGNWTKARDVYAGAEELFRAQDDKRGELYAKFGRLHRDVEAGSYSRVLKQVQLDLANPIVQSDPQLKIRALALKGTIDLNLDTAAAQRDFLEIREVAKSIGDEKWQNRATGQLGIAAGLNGDIGTAAVALFGALGKAAGMHDIAAQVTFSVWLANGMSVHGMGDKAIQILDRAIDTLKHAPDTEVPAQLYIAKVRALSSLPDDTVVKNPRTEAKRLIDQTLAYARENKILGAQTELLNQAGLLALAEHYLKQAEEDFTETARIAGQADLPRMSAEALLHLCQLYREEGRFSDAGRAIDKGILQQKQVQEGYDLPQYLAEKAELEAALGHLRSADSLYDQATDLIEAMLIDAPTSRVKSEMVATMDRVYLGHFRLAVNRFHNPRKAFTVVESARGRALMDTIRYSAAPKSSRTPAPTEEEIARIQKTLRETAPSRQETKRMLGELEQAYDELIPLEYQQNRHKTPQSHAPVSLARLQKSLRSDESLVEYVTDAKSSYAIEIDSAVVRIHRLPSRNEIDKLTRDYVSAIKEKADSDTAGRAIFDRVVSPALSRHPKTLIVVPDGSLHLVPFASLRDGNGQDLMKSIAIVSAPSATIFEDLRSTGERSPASKPFLGIAYSPVARNSGGSQPITSLNSVPGVRPAKALTPLAYVDEEISAAAQVFGGASITLQSDSAYESKLKSEPLNDFKIIHIAAHAIADSVEPDRASLVFGPGPGAEDGFWQAREIRNSRLSADLVTLSACDTGVGRLQGEEGVMNLARAFLAAGAKTVVASMWSANDRSIATLMRHFYRHIADGDTIAEALRNAQLDILSEFGNDVQPYYWAGFTVIGDGTRKISFQTSASKLQATRGDLR